MLPFILGGVALAAVGYGVKEYCESEGCPWDKEENYTAPRPKNMFEQLYTKKKYIQKYSLETFRTLLTDITKGDASFPLVDVMTLDKEKLENAHISDEMSLYVNIYQNILNDTSTMIDVYCLEVEKLRACSSNVRNYNKNQKKLIKKAFKFLNATQNILTLQLIDATQNVSIQTIEALREYKELVEKHKVFLAEII